MESSPVTYFCLLITGLYSSVQGSSSPWYGTAGQSVTLPCPASVSEGVSICSWSVLLDTDPGTQLIFTLPDILSGKYPTLTSTATSCSLVITTLTLGDEGEWTCKDGSAEELVLAYSLIVRYTSKPNLFFEGTRYTDGEQVNIQEAETYQMLCIVDRARPAVSIRWMVQKEGSLAVNMESTGQATSATYTVDNTELTHVSSSLTLPVLKEYVLVSCHVSHESLTSDEIIGLNLNVNIAAESGYSMPLVFWQGVQQLPSGIVYPQVGSVYHVACMVDRARPTADIRWQVTTARGNDQLDFTYVATQAIYDVDQTGLTHVASALPLLVEAEFKMISCSVAHAGIISNPVELHINGTGGAAGIKTSFLGAVSVLLLCLAYSVQV